MKRYFLLISLALLTCGAAGAQSLTSITIGTSFTTLSGANPVFAVDGTQFTSPQNFTWPVGSKHIVQFVLSIDANGNALGYQSGLNDTVRYAFGGWVATSSVPLTGIGGSFLTISADPTLTSLIAQVSATYRVHIVLANTPPANGTATCAGAPANPGNLNQQGIIFFGGQCFSTSTDNLSDPFVSAGTYPLNAFPYPGWVFYGWSIGSNPPNFLSSVTIPGPMQIIALFSLAKRVNFVTNPPGLKIIVDGSEVNTVVSGTGSDCLPDTTRLPPNAPPGFVPLCAGQFDFLPGSKHTIGSQTSQLDTGGKYWVFEQFSTGGGQNSVYTAGMNTSAADTVNVSYSPGVHVSILTNPGHLKVVVDGRDNWPNNNFIWGQGDTHTIGGENSQSLAGRVYQFASWSDGGMFSHSVTVGSSDMAVTANYGVLNQVSISTSPAALNFTVDGSACVSPCVVNRAAGATAQISAPPTVSAGPGSRYDFLSWSDGSTAAVRTITFSQDSLSLTANYQTSFQFSGVINPAKAGTFQVKPASPDGFYPSGTPISFTVASNGGFKFAHWEGDLTGPLSPGTLLMNSPHVVQADFATVPFIPAAGIQSVTGPTPDGSVAPGSVVSIYGENLAPALQVGPNNPLSQSLAGVTVTIGDFLLPLVFVSPNQISAQIPWELPEGTYTLVVHSSGQPDVPGQVTITRNAPGVFTQPNDQQLPLILALRPDGTVVSFQNPAQIGEQITIYGTGFGPYSQAAVDGFPSAGATQVTLVDPVAVNTDSGPLTPDFAGAAPGIVGVSLLKVTLTNAMPPSSNVNLVVQVNGKQSTQVVLPIQ